MHNSQPASTATLIGRIHAGHSEARDELFARCLPMLRRFARGRLPTGRRDLAETEDLVQLTLMRALNRLDDFDARGRGAFFAYLRTVMLNAVREELRRLQRHPHVDGEPDEHASAGTLSGDLIEDSVVANAIGGETLAAYEQALEKLDERQRQAVILRVEFDLSYAEIALELDCPSADAARMQVARALKRVAELMP
ncbi:MAG: sigma-70 family RNA polymerase sigma factor [Rhodanobacteraceae bacterium]|nr:sigma-70 family RNA polymerase sigma factor [Rhodanobacteraceae bacterium]HRX99646.1 sigma-70 family RNA polymerase sigma factor [Xanthomonadaceae bacterium]